MNTPNNAKHLLGFRRKPLITALEPRILLDGAAVATAVEMVTDVDHQDAASHSTAPEQSVHFTALAPTQVRGADPALNQGRKEVAFVDTGVEDYQTLVDGIGAGIEVRLLDAGQDGLAQLAVWAQQNEGYDAIHLMSHGDEGQVQLGSLTLNGTEAENRAGELGILGRALNQDGDLLLYGCDVAGGEGQAFVERLAELTGADVAASDDLTGAATLGGDWELEVNRGTIDTDDDGISAEAMAAFSHTLAEPTIKNDSTWVMETNGNDAVGQSFTVTESGRLTKIGIAHSLNGVTQLQNTSTLTIYKEEGLGGEIVHEQTGIDLKSVGTVNGDNSYTLYEIEINYNGVLEAGSYTFEFSNPESYSLVIAQGGYGGGLLYYNGTPFSDFDLAFSVTIETAPANAAPAFESSLGDGSETVQLDENSANGTTVFDVDANNGDGGATDSGLTYSIVSGNTDGDRDGNLPFNIDATTGVITVNDTADLDFEDGTASYTLTVRADDGGGSNNTADATVTITLQNSGTGDAVDYESVSNNDDSFVSSGQSFTLTGNMVGQKLTNYGSSIPGENGNSDAYMDSVFSQDRTGNIGGISAPDGYTFRANMFDVWPSSNGGGAVMAAGQSITVVGLRNGQQVVSATVTSFAYGQDPIAQGGAWQRIDLTGTDFLTTDIDTVEFVIGGSMNYLAVDNFVYDHLVLANDAPVLGNLDGDAVAWPGAGNTVSLDAGSDLTVTDTELGALNGGLGDWSGASLTVQRAGGGLVNDVLGFETAGASFTVSGDALQSGGQTFATFTNSNGVLTVSFTGSGTTATTALVQEVLQSLNYRNDTPYGDATLSVSLSDGTSATSAEVTVASDTIYVDQLADDGDGDTGDGFSLREAVAQSASQDGAQTLVFGSSLAGQTLILDSSLALSESLTLDADAAPGLIIGGSGITLVSGVSLSIGNGAGDGLTVNSAIAGAGALVKTGTGTLTLGGSNAYSGGTTVEAGTLAGTTTSLQGDITNNATLTFDQSANGTYTGVIGGSGALVKAGAGTLTLSGTNGYSGTTTVTAGRLAITSDANLGSGALTLDGGTLSNGNATFTLSRDITLGAAGGSVFVVNGDLTLSGVISGSGSLTKLGGRTLTLSGTNTYGGTTNVSAGTLSVVGDANLGSGSLTLSGGTLAVTANGTIDNAINLGVGGGTFSADNIITLSGVISGTGSLTKTGGSWLSLYGNNSYSGDTHINSGGVGVYHNNALGATSGRTTVADGAALSLGNNITLAEDLTLAGAPGFTGGGALSLSGSGDATLTGDITLSGDAGIRVAQSGSQLTLSGTISGDHALTTTGNGTLELSGGNSYSGATTVSAGTLLLNGSLNNTSGVTVNAGAILAGGGDGASTGIINGGLTVNGTLSPGAAAGDTAILVVNGNLAFGATGSLVADIKGTSLGDEYDILSVHGGVTIDSGATLSVTHDYTPGNGDSYRLITNDGSDAISGTFAGLAEGGTLSAGGNSTVLTAYYGATDGGATSGGNELMLQAPVNAPPAFGNLNGGATFVEGGSAVVIDGDVTVSDTELDALAGGNGNYDGATVTLSRQGGTSADDQFGNAGLLGALTQGQSFTYNGVTLGTVTTLSDGLLTLTFNGNATSAMVDGVLQSLTYANGAEDPPVSVTLDWTFSDGAANSAGSNQTLVNITPVNDAPTLSATPANPTFTEGGSAVNVFDTTTFSTVEAGQNITEVTLTLTNLADGAHEKLVIDDTQVTLTGGTSGTSTGGNAVGYAVSVSGTTATITLTGNREAAIWSLYGPTVAYLNTSEDPTAGERVATITSFKDSGGEANGGVDTAVTAASSTITLVAVNDAPTLTATPKNPTYTENGAAVTLFDNVNATAVESEQHLSGLVLTASNLSDGAAERFGVDGSSITLTDGVSGTTSGNGLSYSVAVSGGTATVTLSGGNLSAEGLEALIEGMTYLNSSEDPGTADRVVTLTSLSDDGGVADGGVNTASLSLASTVTVVAVNDAPVAVDDSAAAVEAGGIANGTAGSSASGNVLSDDTDVDGDDSKTVTTIRTGAESGSGIGGTVGQSLAGRYGSLILNANGSYSYVVDDNNAEVQALRVSGQTLTDSFSYTVTDTGGLTDNATLTITIEGSNDAPVAVDDSATAVEAGGTANGTAGSDASGNVLSNDSDADGAANGETQTVTAIRTGAEGGSGTSGTVGQVLAGQYGSLTLNADGTYSYVIDESNAAVQALRQSGQTLTDVFTYTLSDTAGLTDSATLTITIEGSNDAPVAVNDSAAAVEAGGIANGTAGSGASGNVLSNDTDVDGDDSKTVTAIRTGAEGGSGISGTVGTVLAGQYGSLILNANGNYSYVVDESNAAVQALRVSGQTLTDSFSYTVTDTGGQSDSATLTITIDGRNDAPVAVNDSATAVEAGGSANGTAGSEASGNVLSNDTDLDDGDSKTVTAIRTGAEDGSGTGGTVGQALIGQYGRLTLNADGNYSYVIDENNTEVQALRQSGQTLTEVFTYTLSDTDGLTDSATLTITIDGRNDAPVAQGTAIDEQWNFGADYRRDISTLFTDVDSAANGEALDFVIQGLPEGLSYHPSTGVIVGKPVESGKFVITLTAVDQAGASVTRHFQLEVLAPPKEEPANRPVNRIDMPAVRVEKTPVVVELSALPQGLVNQDSGEPSGAGFVAPVGPGERVLLAEPGALVVQTVNAEGQTSLRASVDVNVNEQGEVVFSEGQQQALDAVALRVSRIVSAAGNELVISIVDGQGTQGQRYSGALPDGTELPAWISVDPKTGHVRLLAPADIRELTLQIQATGSDGQVRILEIRVDVEALQGGQQAGTPEPLAAASGFVPLSEQLASEVDGMESYGSRLLGILSTV
ncbi:hypothetical protein GU3_06185 [Oceanimonas sp. GK1]|uniref:VCBS domain-containing protein n=1 Tax=Oceanimonas sp. (strain GK1 / IBRC-M 10197) TaxID=511062 RepID=UPI000249535A|nr:VCBS domain-containing protein [Oceanimonas sp. GK1]AEY00993.1 hypothetical protein GU3_06185 [Oceanimonas sp. GK1]